MTASMTDMRAQGQQAGQGPLVADCRLLAKAWFESMTLAPITSAPWTPCVIKRPCNTERTQTEPGKKQRKTGGRLRC